MNFDLRKKFTEDDLKQILHHNKKKVCSVKKSKKRILTKFGTILANLIR